MTAIASTTHVDRHFERMTKAALESMAQQIRTRYIPQLIEHDFNKHIGVLLYGKVAKMHDGEFGLYVVSGLFDNKEEKCIYLTGSPKMVWNKYQKYLDDLEELITVEKKINKPEVVQPPIPSNLADLLEIHLDSTAI